MDAKDLKYENGEFDVILDKGTLDSVLCGNDSTENTKLMLREVYRVLNENGIYFYISYGKPEYREIYLNNPEFSWEVLSMKIAKPNIGGNDNNVSVDKEDEGFHYIYICKKKED